MQGFPIKGNKKCKECSLNSKLSKESTLTFKKCKE
jgi:hypothetical protein